MSDAAVERPAYEELEANASTQAHINVVRRLLRQAAVELLMRGESHDLSKFSAEEVEMFTRFTPRLRGMTYGSDEYKTCLAEMGPGLRHHYENNRHHPEHFAGGIDDMNLLDVIEMFIDWKASSQRHADGNLGKSIDINEKRFAMSPQLAAIFRNTARDWEALGA